MARATGADGAKLPRQDRLWDQLDVTRGEILRKSLVHMVPMHGLCLALGWSEAVWTLQDAGFGALAGLILPLLVTTAFPRVSARTLLLTLACLPLPLDAFLWWQMGHLPLGENLIRAGILAGAIWPVLAVAGYRQALLSMLIGFWRPWHGWTIPDSLWRPRPVPESLLREARAYLQQVRGDDPRSSMHRKEPAEKQQASLLALGFDRGSAPDARSIEEAHTRKVATLNAERARIGASTFQQRLRELANARENLLEKPDTSPPMELIDPSELSEALEKLWNDRRELAAIRLILQLSALYAPGQIKNLMKPLPERTRYELRNTPHVPQISRIHPKTLSLHDEVNISHVQTTYGEIVGGIAAIPNILHIIPANYFYKDISHIDNVNHFPALRLSLLIFWCFFMAFVHLFNAFLLYAILFAMKEHGRILDFHNVFGLIFCACLAYFLRIDILISSLFISAHLASKLIWDAGCFLAGGMKFGGLVAHMIAGGILTIPCLHLWGRLRIEWMKMW